MDRMRKRKLVVCGESFYGKSLHEHLLGRNVCLLTFQFRVTVLLPQPPDFLRILGERRQSEARLRRELGRARGEECSSCRAHSRPFTLLPSRWTRASLSSSFRLSPKIRKKLRLFYRLLYPSRLLPCEMIAFREAQKPLRVAKREGEGLGRVFRHANDLSGKFENRSVFTLFVVK